MAALCPPKRGRGHRLWLERQRQHRPARLATDKSYDSADFRQELRRWGMQPSIPRREWPNRRRRPGRPREVHEASKGRWKVEWSHGWLDNWRRLVTRYDWYTQSYVAFLTIACFMAALSRILDYEIFGTGSTIGLSSSWKIREFTY